MSYVTDCCPAGNCSPGFCTTYDQPAIDAAVKHETVITQPSIIGGYAVACRCGYGRWFDTHDAAYSDQWLHRYAFDEPLMSGLSRF